MRNQSIGILKMPIGNLQSAFNAVYENGFDPEMVDEDDDFSSLSHLIVPGDGHFKAVMDHLNAHGLTQKILEFAATGKPLLGICVGMQILSSTGHEGEVTSGLNLVPGKITRLPDGDGLRLPHMGWNNVDVKRAHPVLDGLKPNRDFYFIHSYAYEVEDEDNALATANYGREFPCIVGKNNVLGFQFHPEKSQINGLKLIENFCNWDGQC